MCCRRAFKVSVALWKSFSTSRGRSSIVLFHCSKVPLCAKPAKMTIRYKNDMVRYTYVLSYLLKYLMYGGTSGLWVANHLKLLRSIRWRYHIIIAIAKIYTQALKVFLKSYQLFLVTAYKRVGCCRVDFSFNTYTVLENLL